MAPGQFSSAYNPDFGNGCFHRRIRLVHSQGGVEAQLEDSSHAFHLSLQYSHGVVTGIESGMLRYPLSTCPGAIEPLRAFEGQRLDTSLPALNTALNARSNCTHLYDLAVLAMAQARRRLGTRVYDVLMPDELDQPTTLTVLLDGQPVLEWQVKNWAVAGPEPLAGNTLHAGFAGWWRECCDNDEAFEYGLMAQKGYLVAHARRYDHDATAGQAAMADPTMLGLCHSYSAGTIDHARYTRDSFRDFSNCPEQLLTIFEP